MFFIDQLMFLTCCRSLAYQAAARGRGELDDERRRSVNYARQRLADVVPPKMMELYSGQQTRGFRLPNAVVRSFHDQGYCHRQLHVITIRDVRTQAFCGSRGRNV